MTRRRSAILALGGIVLIVVVLAATRAQPAAAPVATPQPALGFPFTGPPPIDPVRWDGVRWSAVPPGLSLPPGMQVAGMTALPGALLAFGQGPIPAGAPKPLDGLISTGTVWISTNAVAWQAEPIVAGVPNGRVTEIHALAAGPRGIVAFGSICCGADESQAAWWSPDAETWRRAAFAAPLDGGPVAVAAGPAGFAAVGTLGGNDAIWTSVDGLDWRRVAGDAAELGAGSVNDVVATKDGFIAVGQIDAERQHSDGAIWVSQGPDAWHRIAARDPSLVGPDEASLGKIVPFAGGVYAAGGTGTHNERVMCEQLLGGGAVASAGGIALSCGWLREMNWRSPDGTAWERVDPWGRDGAYPPDFVGGPPGRAPISWQFVEAGGPGLVALPYELVEDQLENGGTEVGVWTSGDGRKWGRVATGPSLGGELPVGWGVVGRQIVVMTEKGAVFIGTVLP
jgi:hypothetical protein